MGKQYDNEMRGMLSKNKFKKQDNHPDYTGLCQIRGEKLRIAVWIKENRDGGKYMSLTFQEDDGGKGGNRGGNRGSSNRGGNRGGSDRRRDDDDRGDDRDDDRGQDYGDADDVPF